MTVSVAGLPISKRFIRFVMVGIMNTAFGYGLFASLIYMGLHYAVANIIGMIISILFNFKTIGNLVFYNNDNRLIFRFVTVYAVNFAFGLTGLWIFDQFGVSMYIAGAILPFPAAILTYILQKTFVFRSNATTSGKTEK